MPNAYTRAGDLSSSEFLLGKSIASPQHAVADILGVTMWTGNSNTTIFGGLAQFLPNTESSLDPPTWSMHLELWGSILVLGLVLASRTRSAVFGAVILLAAVIAGITAMALFVCGFLLAHLARSPFASRAVQWPATWLAGGVLIASGLLVTGETVIGQRAAAVDYSPFYSILKPYEWYHAHKAVAALLVFMGLLAIPRLQQWLSMRLIAWFGKLSFAIYLLHLPILMTIGSLTFIVFREVGQNVAVALATLVIFGATLGLATFFEAWIDRPAVGFARSLRVSRTMGAKS